MHVKQNVCVISRRRAGACSRRNKLLSFEDGYEYLSINQYVIMPNHIHVVLISEIKAAGASPIDGNLRGKKEYPYLLKMC